MTGADNQQERPSIDAIAISLGNFLSGFALGEGSFMIVCRSRGTGYRGFRISAAFNVSQRDLVPLELFRATLGCGSLRRAGNNGWYWEVNRLSDLRCRIVPFFDRFPIVGSKAQDYALWRESVMLLSRDALTDCDYRQVFGSPGTDEPWREETSPDGWNPQRLYAEPTRLERRWDEIVRSHGRP